MEDKAIIQLYWDRDQQAIPATADKYGAYCTTIARNILASREDAEECVNDTYLHAWNGMPPQRPDILSAFLGRITRNLSLDRYRRNSAAKRGSGQTDAVLTELSGCVGGVERELERQELVEALNDFLAALPGDKRDMFLCRYWYTDSLGDIARRFSTTENAVAAMLYRLRRKLRTHLEERGVDL